MHDSQAKTSERPKPLGKGQLELGLSSLTGCICIQPYRRICFSSALHLALLLPDFAQAISLHLDEPSIPPLFSQFLFVLYMLDVAASRKSSLPPSVSCPSLV